MTDELDRDALEYHRFPPPGKLEVTPTKPLANQRDLALAYSPGVAACCRAVAQDPLAADELTARANLVGVISNGSAVLGLGNIGPLAAKPVMEGKAVLFKKFAGIDVFDIEINERDPDRLVEIIAALEPTFGGINLEDIKSPECFQVEGKLKRRVKVPVFHDDQHGTAIIASAAILNALDLVGKRLEEVRLVTAGAGAAAIACLRLLVTLGLPRENIIATDLHGVVYRGRKVEMDAHKKRFARDTPLRTLAEAIEGADVFLGLSTGNVLSPEMVRSMARDPVILALANPVPEIQPALAKQARPDAIIATGRSDYPNQVNNVLCFPYIFRGALDVGATEINDEMKIACVHALASIARRDAPDVVEAAYGGQSLSFGPEYLIPKPFDPRLILELAPAVAKAAMESGVATRPIEDMELYRHRLHRFVFQSVLVMKPFFDRAKGSLRRIVYPEGELPTVLRAIQSVVDEGLARPVVIGREGRISELIAQIGLRIEPGEDFDLVAPEGEREELTVQAAALLAAGEADALICGLKGNFQQHLETIVERVGMRPGVNTLATLHVLVLKQGTFFLCDTYVNTDPDAGQIAEMTALAAEEVCRFGLEPRVALLSHSNFGASQAPSAVKMRKALMLIRQRYPELEVEGEMQADAALIEGIRKSLNPLSGMKGHANLLIMPDVDAANISMNLLHVLCNGASVGPILLGLNRSAHILTPAATVRRIVNMSALAVVEAQLHNHHAELHLEQGGAG